MINPRISEFETTKNKLRAYKIKLKFVEVSERWRHERFNTNHGYLCRNYADMFSKLNWITDYLAIYTSIIYFFSENQAEETDCCLDF